MASIPQLTPTVTCKNLRDAAVSVTEMPKLSPFQRRFSQRMLTQIVTSDEPGPQAVLSSAFHAAEANLLPENQLSIITASSFSAAFTFGGIKHLFATMTSKLPLNYAGEAITSALIVASMLCGAAFAFVTTRNVIYAVNLKKVAKAERIADEIANEANLLASEASKPATEPKNPATNTSS